MNTILDIPDGLFTESEAANLLECSGVEIRRRNKEGLLTRGKLRLPSGKMTRQYYYSLDGYSRDDLEQFDGPHVISKSPQGDIGRQETENEASMSPQGDTVATCGDIDHERDNGWIILRDSYQGQKEIIRRLEIEADDYKAQVTEYKGQAQARGRLNMMLTAALFPLAVLAVWGFVQVGAQADKINDGKTAQAGLTAQITAEQERTAAANNRGVKLESNLTEARQAAQVERERHLSQIDNLTRRITELSLTIESERKNQAELASLKQTLEILTVGGAEVSSGVPIGPALQSE